MKFMEIINFLVESSNEYILEDNVFFSIETEMGYDHNKYIIKYKESFTNNGRKVDSVIVKDNSRIVEIHYYNNSVEKLDTKDLMTVRNDVIKRSIVQAISLANKKFERNEK